MQPLTLQPGDTVSLIAPASQCRGEDRDLLAAGVALLERWQLRVRVRVDASNHFYLAGPDPVRAGHLLDALGDAETRAIFCMRGGYGCTRLLPALARAPAPTPRLLVGFSDITALHLACARLWPQVRGIHAPNVATRQLLGEGAACEANRRALHAALFDPHHAISAPIRALRPGRASGPLVGGCLSLIASCLGTPFAPDTRGAVLFLEDVDEAPYRIDRMLTQARLAGLFEGVAGIVFGDMHGCHDAHNDLGAVIDDALQGLDVPIGIGLPSGHGPENLSLRLGEMAELDADGGMFRFLGGGREALLWLGDPFP